MIAVQYWSWLDQCFLRKTNIWRTKQEKRLYLRLDKLGSLDQDEIYATKIRTLKLLKNLIFKNGGCSNVKFLHELFFFLFFLLIGFIDCMHRVVKTRRTRQLAQGTLKPVQHQPPFCSKGTFYKPFAIVYASCKRLDSAYLDKLAIWLSWCILNW
jgi:hypothetical protein